MSEPPSPPRPPGTPPHAGHPEYTYGETPRKHKFSTHELFATMETPLSTVHQRLVEETRGHYLGPMPVKLFFEDFMQWKTKTKSKRQVPNETRIEDLKSLQNPVGGSSYKKLITALNNWPLKHSTMDVVDSHSYRDQGCKGLGVDITLYAKRKPLIPRETQSKMDFANAQSWIEIKPSRDYDPFVDPEPVEESDQEEDKWDEMEETMANEEEEEEREEGQDDEEDGGGEGSMEAVGALDVTGGFEQVEVDQDLPMDETLPEVPQSSPEYPFENSTVRGRGTRAQLATYAGATMATQFRSHLFTTLIIGSWARFIRWDRGGAIVTEAFNYVESPNLIFEFFNRFAQLSPSERGCNPNISPATQIAARVARQALKNLAAQLWLGQAGKVVGEGGVDIETQPFMQLKIDGRTFILPSPHCSETGLSPFGRASRGRAIVDFPSGQVLYLKDSWQNPNRPSEVEVYKRLKDKGVNNVANLDYGGPFGLPTSTQLYLKCDWVSQSVKKPLNLRELHGVAIALDVVGRSLVAFRTAHELVSCLADGMEAYEEALSKAKVMHRDISANNILIVSFKDNSGHKRRKGILIDWDHAIFLDDTPAPQPLRTGTWCFMSLALKLDPQAKHTVQDDRESALHVLTWISLRHLNHNISDNILMEYLSHYDAMNRSFDDGNPVGLDAPLAVLQSGYRRLLLTSKPVEILIKDLASVFAIRYDANIPSTAVGPFDDPAWLVGRLRSALPALEPEGADQIDWTNHVRRIWKKDH